MIKKHLVLAALLLAVNTFAQCPSSNLIFNSQAQIDAFAVDYVGCSAVSGSVTISGSDIIDLSGLTGISSIGGQLIIENNDILTTLSGWDEVALLGASAKITIQHNDLLEELTTFFGVLNEGLILNNLQSLNDLSGFNGISSTGFLYITNCEALTDFLGLENVAVENQLIIESNLLLSDISQLNSVIGPLQTLQIGINPELVTFSGLQGLDMLSSGAAYLYSNNSINNLDAFTGWTTAPAILEIGDNASLSSLTGLAGVSGPVTSLSLILNDVLTNYNGLQGITKAASLTIDNNSGLLSLAGLNGLINDASETCEIIINGNTQLTDISALNGMNPAAVTFLEIDTNTSLAFCNEILVCGVLELATAGISIIGNASGCETIESVEEACVLNVNEYALESAIILYPNPTIQQLNIMLPEAILLEKVTVFDLTGKELMLSSSNVIEVTTLSAGVYFVQVTTNRGSTFKRLIKN